MQNERNCEGIWIPIEVWENRELKMMEKIFLVEIKSLDQKKYGGCFASNAYFSEFFGLSKNRCSEIIKSLEKKGFIKIRYIIAEHSKNIEKRLINVTIAYYNLFNNLENYSENRPTPSESRQTPSEKCEDNNLCNKLNKISEVEKLIKEKEEIIESRKKRNKEIDMVFERYNAIEDISKCVKRTDARKGSINARIDDYGLEEVFNALEKVDKSNFLKGDNNRDFKANIDWVFNPNNFVKILEDRYKNRPTKQPKKQEKSIKLEEMF